MRLLISKTSPYGRVVQAAIYDRGLTDLIEEVIVKTRVPDCVVNDFNPTGKIPTLVLDNGVALSECRIICKYLDTLHHRAPIVDETKSLREQAQEGIMVGFLDGASVLLRELRRPESDRSTDIIGQERRRADRCLKHFDDESGRLTQQVEYGNLCLSSAVDLCRTSLTEDLAVRFPRVIAWHDAFKSIAALVKAAPR